MAKPVFIVGYMGCGKSTVGKKLASKLKFSFIDIDEAIEQMTGKTVTQIFNEDGESAFRQLERSILVSLCSRTNIVVSTGGGTPCFFDNMALMKRSGPTIYLRMHPDSLASRIIASKTDRPLLQRLTNEELPAYIKQHLAEREVYYIKAAIVVKGESIKADDLYQTLMNAKY